MAWANTAYVIAANYRETNGAVSTDFDTSRGVLATTVSRILDDREGVSPAHFAPQTEVTYTVRCTGGTLLYLRDERGWQMLLRTATAIAVDSEMDGTFDGYTLTLATDVFGYPMNAATYSEPYTALELRPGYAASTLYSWPRDALVRITGNWGFAAVPGGVAERVTRCMRELVEVGYGGPHVDMESVAAALDGNRSTVALLERRYNYSIPAFG